MVRGSALIVRGDEPVATDYTILPTVLIYITFKRVLARQDQVRIVIELKRFFNVQSVKRAFWNFLVLYGKYEIELRIL